MLRQIAMAACERTKKIIKDKNRPTTILRSEYTKHSIFHRTYLNASPQ